MATSIEDPYRVESDRVQRERGMRRKGLVLLIGLIALFAAWGTARAVDSWRYRTSMEKVKASIAAGSTSEARKLLVEAVERWPREGELQFLLGACEQALGRTQAAEEAWARVEPTSAFAGNAAMLRVRLLLKRDRFAAAEELLPIALRASGQHATEGARPWLCFSSSKGASMRRGC